MVTDLNICFCSCKRTTPKESTSVRSRSKSAKMTSVGHIALIETDNYQELNDGTDADDLNPNDLKLRIISEPLHNKKTNSTSKCLCCKDFVSPLSDQERVIKLTIGFMRKYSTEKIYSDIYSLCIDYVGDKSGFNAKQLRSNKELRKMQCTLQRCWLHGPFCQCVDQSQGDWDADCDLVDASCGRWLLFISGLLKYVILGGFLFGKDIAALVINGMNDCNDTIESGSSQYISFDVSTWIVTGCSVHLIGLMIQSCIPFCYEFYEKERLFKSAFCGLATSGSFLLFSVAWLVIGFLLWSEMDSTEDTICQNAVLSWSIIQAVAVFVISVRAVAWYRNISFK